MNPWLGAPSAMRPLCSHRFASNRVAHHVDNLPFVKSKYAVQMEDALLPSLSDPSTFLIHLASCSKSFSRRDRSILAE